MRHFEYTFFNDYPTAKPVQTAQDTDGTITGSVRAFDADGDKISYTFTNPLHGTVVIDDKGTYTYVPDAAWAHAGGGADSFTVVVGDETGNPWHLHGPLDLIGRTKPTEVEVRRHR